MALDTRKLLTIITEAALETELIAVIQDLGAHGYTVSDARGSGSRGVRSASWAASANVRIDVVCSEPTATLIAEALQQRYYDNYAMVLFVTAVEVLRPSKF